MNFFLRIEAGQPVGNPMDADSVRVLHNGRIPVDYAPFRPAGPPVDLGPYEVTDAAPQYAERDGVWTHDYNRRDMTAEEKAAHVAAIQAQWSATEYSSWVWDEAGCRYRPPVEPPTDDGIYHWDETSLTWKDGPGPTPEE